jgi:hypothetical protein
MQEKFDSQLKCVKLIERTKKDRETVKDIEFLTHFTKAQKKTKCISAFVPLRNEIT